MDCSWQDTQHVVNPRVQVEGAWDNKRGKTVVITNKKYGRVPWMQVVEGPRLSCFRK